MFQTLIDNAALAAKAVADTQHLPPDAEGLRAHAADFPATVAPQLAAMAEAVGAFARTATETTQALKPQIDAWSAGQGQAREAIVSGISHLVERLSGAMASNQAAFATLARYRDQVLVDQRLVAQISRDLAARIAALRDQLDHARNEAETQRKRLDILRMIPFPLPWIVAEIANLIKSGHTLEQELSQLQQQQAELQGQAAATAGGMNAVQGFAGQLDILENATQNLITFTSTAQGNMMQMMQALTGGAGSTVPAVVAAYVATLAAEAGSIQHYLSDG